MIFLIAVLVSTSLRAHDIFDVRAVKIRDGVHLVQRPEPLRPFVDGNVTVIINERDVVVVDAGGTPTTARNVIAEIRKLTALPVRYVINTHIHRDHRFGLQEFVKAFPGVEIIAHSAVRKTVVNGNPNYMSDVMKRFDTLPEEGKAEIARVKARGGPGSDAIVRHLERYYFQDLGHIRRAYESLVNTAPTMVLDDRLQLHRGKREIDIRFPGRGDTDDNIVVFLPAERVLIAGDLVVHPVPYGFSTHPIEWLDTLRKLEALDFDVIIPGHGDPQNKSYVSQLIRLLESVHSQVRAAIASGGDLEAVRKRVTLADFETQFAGDDPVARYYFGKYFTEPYVERLFRALTRVGAQ